MARKKRQIPEVEQAELPAPELAANDISLIESDAAEPAPVNAIRILVRPVPAMEWDTLVTEMHDYTTIRRNLIDVSLSKSRETATKFVAFKKTARDTAQTQSGIVLRDDIPAVQPPKTEDHVHLDEFYRNGRIRRKK
jgi:hypothetical protein